MASGDTYAEHLKGTRVTAMGTPIVGYIDPASGAILLQVILAGIIGGLAYFRRVIWSVLCSVFRVTRTKDSVDE